jgi:hypothetical protein
MASQGHDPALRQRLDVPIQQHACRGLDRAAPEVRQGDAEDHASAAVAFGTALAAVGVDREADRLTWEIVRVRLAADQERAQGEDRRARHVDELGVKLLAGDLRPHGRPQPPRSLPAAETDSPQSERDGRRSRARRGGRLARSDCRATRRWASRPRPPTRRNRAAWARSRRERRRSDNPRRRDRHRVARCSWRLGNAYSIIEAARVQGLHPVEIEAKYVSAGKDARALSINTVLGEIRLPNGGHVDFWERRPFATRRTRPKISSGSG